MTLCKIKDTKPYIQAVQQAIHSRPEGKYQHRLHVVLMALRYLSSKKASELYGEPLRTVQYWVQQFLEKGVEGLRDKPRPGKPSRLNKEQKEELKEDILKSPLQLGYSQNDWDGKLLSHHIYKKYQIVLKVRQCQYLFHKLGFTLQRPRTMPNGDVEKKRIFKKKPVIS